MVRRRAADGAGPSFLQPAERDSATGLSSTSSAKTSCAGFYHAKLGRPSLPPGLYFRVMMIGFFEGHGQ